VGGLPCSFNDSAHDPCQIPPTTEVAMRPSHGLLVSRVMSGASVFAAGVILAVAASPGRAAPFSWTAAATGFYDVGGNWTPAGPPGAGDDATIAATGAAYTVTLRDADRSTR
jgi:hypothetical protein